MAREHYEAYKRMLLKLHELDAQGKGQTAEANKIRAEMELPERHLSPLEQERLDGLSGDLYMLVGEEVKEPADDTATPFAFRDLLRSKQWDDLLSILRKSNVPVQEDILACLRAVCWEALGDCDVSLLFVQHALKLQPNNRNYRVLSVLNRLKLGVQVDATELADIFIQGEQSEIRQILNESVQEIDFLQPA
ncbi:MAG TPA: hypothetical protein VKX17_10815 [Planctomycetota bacterium]|nr:hypothetical protein [Planctomycetota bacterium]